MPNHRAHRQPEATDLVERRTLRHAPTQREAEADLIDVSCRRCLAPLATVLPRARNAGQLDDS